MKTIKVLCLLLLLQISAGAQNTISFDSNFEVDQWIQSAFASTKNVPFSFLYDGKPSQSLIKKWKHQLQALPITNASEKKYIATYIDPVTKLKVVCNIDVYTKFNTVSWTLHLTNDGNKNTPQITQLHTSNIGIKGINNANKFHLYSSLGSDHNINDFKLSKTELIADKRVHLSPSHGRSSDTQSFPFFNVELEGHGGVLAAIGWTGTWFADLDHSTQRGATIQSGMKYLDTYLEPGESIRTPMISLTFWKGSNFMTGHNQFRRYVLEHQSRKVDGKFAQYPLSGGFEWGDPAPCNEYTCLTEDLAIAFINRYKQFGITPEVYWLDAGWYEGSGGPNFENANWANTVGTWRIDSTRFPRGFKPVSDAAHKVGAKFMVWFEPERVMRESAWAKEIPQWLLRRKDDPNMFLFDLGNKEAREWLSKYIGDFLEENGIDYYRQDFNMPIDQYWKEKDTPKRIGIAEIRYIEGLYAYWDYLLERFPNLLIDNCASGGRRLDLETTRRSAPLWRTDYNYGEPNGYQNHTYGLHFYLPLHGTGVFGFDEYSFHSALSSAMVLNWELTSRHGGGDIREMQRQHQLFHTVRPYFYEDYYPLSGLGDLSQMNVWLAYQLHKPSDHSGVIVAFRRKDNTQKAYTVSLNGVDANARYTITNLTTKKEQTVTGKQLQEGFTIDSDKTPYSAVFHYKKH